MTAHQKHDIATVRSGLPISRAVLGPCADEQSVRSAVLFLVSLVRKTGKSQKVTPGLVSQQAIDLFNSLADDPFYKVAADEAALDLLVEIVQALAVDSPAILSIALEYGLAIPAYQFQHDYWKNEEFAIPDRPSIRALSSSKSEWSSSFCGREIGFPLGLAATPLTANSRWIRHYAAYGYSVITYKTVRHDFSPGERLPQWGVVDDVAGAWTDGGPTCYGHRPAFVRPGSTQLSMANSYNIPSRDTRHWIKDFYLAQDQLESDGQLLILSVERPTIAQQEVDGKDRSSAVDDFVEIAQSIVEESPEHSQVQFVELNFSNPNDRDRRKLSASEMTLILRKVRSALPRGTRVGVKLPLLREPYLGKVLDEIAHNVDFVSAINCIPTRVLDRENQREALLAGREIAAVSGWVIHDLAVAMVRSINIYRRTHGLQFGLIGMGGVGTTTSFKRMYDAGADVVQIGTASLTDPFLIAACIDRFTPGDLLRHISDDDEVYKAILARLASFISSSTSVGVSAEELSTRAAVHLHLPEPLVSELLQSYDLNSMDLTQRT